MSNTIKIFFTLLAEKLIKSKTTAKVLKNNNYLNSTLIKFKDISINNLFLKPLTTILKQSCLENKEVFHKRIKLETQIQNKHINTNISSRKKITYLRLIKRQKKTT